MNNESNYSVSADPAKGFFVSMLIKDITLKDAIGDLIDNAVDAIKSRATNVDDLSSYNIEISLGKDIFTIKDNGSGMGVQIARETAFNFGKSSDHELIDHSIGQFGIGMKRAFFKIGKTIDVTSITINSKFEIKIDVDNWLKAPNDWTFEFTPDSLVEDGMNNEGNTGFEVSIGNLSSDANDSFRSEMFIDQLRKEIEYEHMLNLAKGLSITINGYTLQSKNINLVYDDNIKPTFWEKITDDGLSIKILAGISTKDDEEGGWYVFCNGRLIIAKNKTSETVWTGNKGDGVPLWHAQYHKFRGYVFLESKESNKLPWNTTKTGMDLDSPIYKLIRSKMILLTKQVMELLDKLKSEKERSNPEESQKLNKIVEKSIACPVSVSEVLTKTADLTTKFTFPTSAYNPLRKTNSITIRYDVSKDRYNEVKDELGVSTVREVGLKTFDYFYENEL